MTVVKRLSKKRRAEILSQIDMARNALLAGDQIHTIYALDKAMKVFNGWDDSGAGTMRYDELNDACTYFLKETGYLSLSSLLIYIEHWKKQDPMVDLAKAVLETECDMTHYWRCEAWNTEEGKRRSSDPSPSDERCTCGLTKIVLAMNKIEATRAATAD